jgi:hypothetical protein
MGNDVLPEPAEESYSNAAQFISKTLLRVAWSFSLSMTIPIFSAKDMTAVNETA